MGWNGCSLSLLLFFFFFFFSFLTIELAAFSFISNQVVFEDQRSTGGRSLLQTKKACPVNFQSLNYTVITSQCKGPQYPPKLCCGAFKQFACPYAKDINDLTNKCADTMFSYINLYGNYPAGLFASECKEGKEGLACPAPAPGSADDKNRGQIARILSPFLVTTGFLLLLAQIF